MGGKDGSQGPHSDSRRQGVPQRGTFSGHGAPRGSRVKDQEMNTLYGLTDNPFALTPDPKFVYWSRTHRQAFQLFVRGQQRPQGILVVTGGWGTGKTTLLQAFATSPAPRTRLVSLPHAAASVDDLYVRLA
jgi:type II secretory pathway predicted ATPase ExeA